MSEMITYKITDSANRVYYVTTDMMDETALWYRGNSALNLSEDGTQYTSRRSLVANSKLISNPATGGGSTTYTTIRTLEVIGTTSGTEMTWTNYLILGVLLVFAVVMVAKRRRKPKW